MSNLDRIRVAPPQASFANCRLRRGGPSPGVPVELALAPQAELKVLPSFNVPSLPTDVPKLDGRRVINGYKLQVRLRRRGCGIRRGNAFKRLYERHPGLRAAVSAEEAGLVGTDPDKALVAKCLGVSVVEHVVNH